jgi:hypothetical protein
MLHSGKIGNLVLGSIFGNYVLRRFELWNSWDDIALIKGIYRRPNESNIVFRSRFLSAHDYDSTKQGMINWLCDSFDIDKFTVVDKTIFYSKYTPLSYVSYLKLDSDETYLPPQVIADDITYTFPQDEYNIGDVPIEFDGFDSTGEDYKYYCSNERTDIYDTTKLKKFTLWKDVDQSYFPIWESNFAPATIKLIYQTVIDGELFAIEESCIRYTRDDQGNIVEE